MENMFKVHNLEHATQPNTRELGLYFIDTMTGTISVMTYPISVNDAIDRLTELAGQNISVFGWLSLQFEGTSINHVPKAESRTGTYQSSIWVNFDLTAINQREQWLDQFNGRHVRVTGELVAPQDDYGGCGHFSLWPAELNVTSIERYSAVPTENE